MNPLEQAFLNDIAAQPQDDAPRLIFADWLEEQGREEQAEFVRVQCQLARHAVAVKARGNAFPAPPMHPDFLPSSTRDELRRRERELFSVNVAQTLRWFGLPQPWARVVRLKPFDPDYPCAVASRGFIASITLPTNVFLQCAADIIEAVPMLEEVRLSDKTPTFYAQRDGGGWYKIDESGYENHYLLPSKLFDRLKEGFLDESMETRDYERHADAQRDLSQACLTHAREQLARRRKQQEQQRLILLGNPNAPAPQGRINYSSKK